MIKKYLIAWNLPGGGDFRKIFLPGGGDIQKKIVSHPGGGGYRKELKSP